MLTYVLVAAFRSPTGALREIVRLLYEGGIEGFASVPIMLEYEEVVLRLEQREATGLDVSDVHIILDPLAMGVASGDDVPAAQYFRLEVLRLAELLRRL